jgi:hypothetical protein
MLDRQVVPLVVEGHGWSVLAQLVRNALDALEHAHEVQAGEAGEIVLPPPASDELSELDCALG